MVRTKQTARRNAAAAAAAERQRQDQGQGLTAAQERSIAAAEAKAAKRAAAVGGKIKKPAVVRVRYPQGVDSPSMSALKYAVGRASEPDGGNILMIRRIPFRRVVRRVMDDVVDHRDQKTKTVVPGARMTGEAIDLLQLGVEQVMVGLMDHSFRMAQHRKVSTVTSEDMDLASSTCGMPGCGMTNTVRAPRSP